MLKEHSRLMIVLLGVADLVATVVAWCGACLVFGHREVMLRLLPAVLVVALVSNLAHRLYRPRRRESLLGEVVELMRSSLSMWLVVVAGLFLTGRHAPGNHAMVFFLGANCAVLILGRAVAREGLRQLRRRGYNLRHVALVGSGLSAREVVRGLNRNPWYGMVIDYVVPADDHDDNSFEGIPCRGSIDHLDDVLREHPVDMVYLALRRDSDHLLENLVDRLAGLHVEIRHVPDVQQFARYGLAMGDVDGLPVMALMDTPLKGWRQLLKSTLDRLAAVALIALTALPMALVALAVKLHDGGPVFFRQTRVGLDGRPFTMLKFRTYPTDTSDGTQAHRPTGLGKLLRRTSLDELPQLFNVLVGHMSLVGPRPETVEWMQDYRRRLPRYMLRHRVRSGMTGWAQVHGLRGDTPVDLRLQYDLYYVFRWSMALDVKILVMTLAGGFIDRGCVHPGVRRDDGDDTENP